MRDKEKKQVRGGVERQGEKTGEGGRLRDEERKERRGT